MLSITILHSIGHFRLDIFHPTACKAYLLNDNGYIQPLPFPLCMCWPFIRGPSPLPALFQMCVFTSDAQPLYHALVYIFYIRYKFMCALCIACANRMAPISGLELSMQQAFCTVCLYGFLSSCFHPSIVPRSLPLPWRPYSLVHSALFVRAWHRFLCFRHVGQRLSFLTALLIRNVMTYSFANSLFITEL